MLFSVTMYLNVYIYLYCSIFFPEGIMCAAAVDSDRMELLQIPPEPI